MRLHRLTLPLLLSLSAFACETNEESDPESSSDQTGSFDGPRGEVTDEPCSTNAECNDQVFCNGVETCEGGFCRLGVAPLCDDGIECTIDSCSHTLNSCRFEAPDRDGDGHIDFDCIDASGERLGDDCDDQDANRFPGNSEVCSATDSTHDEDCDPSTFGYLDADLDGYIDAACCNENREGELLCGDDCDDEDYRRYPSHPEICDDIDNDCDGQVDVNTREVPWYVDADDDNFGDASSESILSCAPLEGRSLRSTDCDDGTAAVHSAALEVCDGADNDCDGEIDEDNVCACAPEGNLRACACDSGRTGVQNCSGGLWNTCDCTECVPGAKECVGGLIPRECIAGLWVVQTACSGARPLCSEGICLCVDGSQNCEEIEDIIPPTIIASSPSAGSQISHDTVSSVAVIFGEGIQIDQSEGDALQLLDFYGQPVPGTTRLGGKNLLLDLDEPLQPGSTYTIRVNPALTDLSGNATQATDIHFSTASTAEVSRQPAPNGWEFALGEFRISPSGERMGLWTLADENQFADRRYELWRWNGGTWDKTVHPLETSSGKFIHAFEINDSGEAVTVSGTNEFDGTSTSDVRFFDGTSWESSVQSYSQSYSTVSASFKADGSFLALAAVADGSSSLTSARVLRKTANDIWLTPTNLGPADFTNLTIFTGAAVSSSGYAAWVVSDESLELKYTISNQAQDNWSTPAILATTAGDSLSSREFVVDDEGTITAAFLDSVEGPASINLANVNRLKVIRHAYADRGTTSTATPLELTPRDDFTIFSFQLAADANGNLFVTYLSRAHDFTANESDLFVTRFDKETGTWSAPFELSPPQISEGIESVNLSVSANGEAYVAWHLSRVFPLSGEEHYLSHFEPAKGWSTQFVYETSGFTTLKQLATDGNGNAVYVTNLGRNELIFIEP
ncbi:MAG: Ig-like domain-containing protein [Polyangiaceae bacterium]|nr:Ig-like domain-containing protein [Polyangiaceae bacterium]